MPTVFAKADEPDKLVPDPQVREEFGGVSLMTLWRWDHDPDLGFAPAIKINGRNYRSRRALEDFKKRMVQRAIRNRSQHRRRHDDRNDQPKRDAQRPRIAE